MGEVFAGRPNYSCGMTLNFEHLDMKPARVAWLIKALKVYFKKEEHPLEGICVAGNGYTGCNAFKCSSLIIFLLSLL
jgi:hypothetical protein